MLIRRDPRGTSSESLVLEALRDAETRRRMFSKARARTRTAEDAEDCVQEASLLAVRAADGYRGSGTLLSWLLQIVVNVCRMRHRSDRRFRRGGTFTVCSLADLSEEWAGECHLSPERLLGARQDLASVNAHLAEECELDRQLLSDLVSREISIAELARLYGLSHEGAKTRLFRLRRRLRVRVELDENGGSRAA